MYTTIQRRKVKRCIYLSKEKVNEQFGRKMNEDVDGNKKCKKGKGGELQQNKGWKWEVSTERGQNAKDLEGVF